MICHPLSRPGDDDDDDDDAASPFETRAVMFTGDSGVKLWPRGATINVFFLDRHDKRDKVLPIASKWSEHCSISFVEVEDVTQSDVRVSFRKEGNFSCVGREAHNQVEKNKPTMNLEDFRKFTILHEFGHVLGLEHEHQSPIEGNIQWNKWKVIAAYRGAPNNWDDDVIEYNILRHLCAASVAGSSYDKFSVMHYSFDMEFIDKINGKPPVIDDFPVITKLSATDKRVATMLYGPRGSVSVQPSPPRTSERNADKYDIKAGERMEVPLRRSTTGGIYVIETTGSEAALAFSLFVGPEGDERLLAAATDGGHHGNPRVTRTLSPDTTYCLVIQAFERGGEFGVQMQPFVA